jgi:GNAT superfamily N-acetyltransferase
MQIREVEKTDLEALQELYLHLHENEMPPVTLELVSLWNEILADENYHILVGEIDDEVLSSLTLVVIKNLTRDMRPYALIENVVTHKDYRGKGYAQKLMQKATDIAQSKSCYKIMLQTGSKEKTTLEFYEKCDFNSTDKTGFVKWL